jgi:hypothetical protein
VRANGFEGIYRRGGTRRSRNAESTSPVGIALGCAALAAHSLACTSHVANVTIFSTRNVEMSAPHDAFRARRRATAGCGCCSSRSAGRPSGLAAATDMIEDQNADYLTNAEVTEGGWTLLAISMGWVTVEADPWRRSGVAAPRESDD